jgi:glutathione peroxidase
MNHQTIYDFEVNTQQGTTLNLSDLKGRVILIVNTASKCLFTKQYTELEQLHKKYHDLGLTILAFPCNQFGNQEPGDAEQIKEFCTFNYDITFPLMAKIEVNGANTIPLYEFLKKRARGILGSTNIKWNFTKFLISRDGNTIVRYAPWTTPKQFEIGIQSLLNEPSA